MEPARKLAQYCQTIHHEYVFTIQEGLDVIPEVIKHLETFDVTTIRSATPQYLLAKKIRSHGFKMVLSGEGSDEAWAGYLYFHFAPNDQELAQECQLKVKNLHHYDCLRTNKIMMASGIETRVPFLDQELLHFCMEILPTSFKHPKSFPYQDKPLEKGYLRHCFQEMLPPDICWRQKAQFSDSVGSRWINGIQNYANEHETHLKEIYPHCETLEAAWFLSIYDSYNYSLLTFR